MPLFTKEKNEPDASNHYCWNFKSDILHHDLKLSISVMDEIESPDSELPVVYLLDANFMFTLVEGMIRLLQSTGELPPLILVGIGYENNSIENIANRRIQEFTPTKDINYKNLWRDIAKVTAQGGEASLLLKVIKGEIKPFVREKYSSSEHSVLVGISLGGLFSLYVFFSEPNLFRGYVVGSPAIFWDEGFLWQHEENYYGSSESLSADLFLGVGELEDVKPYHFPKSVRHLVSDIKLVNDVKAMSKRLEKRGYKQLNIETHIFEGETHMSVIAPLISRGLRFVLAKDNA